MAKFKFETKNGSYVSGCQTDTEELAWKWIAQIKQLPIEQAKEILDLNSKVGLEKIKSRFDATKDGKIVQVSELPYVRVEITQKLRELNRNKNVKN